MAKNKLTHNESKLLANLMKDQHSDPDDRPSFWALAKELGLSRNGSSRTMYRLRDKGFVSFENLRDRDWKIVAPPGVCDEAIRNAAAPHRPVRYGRKLGKMQQRTLHALAQAKQPINKEQLMLLTFDEDYLKRYKAQTPYQVKNILEGLIERDYVEQINDNGSALYMITTKGRTELNK